MTDLPSNKISAKARNGLMARLKREFPNYHPVVELARIANDPENDVKTRADAHKEVAKYVTPQLKAVDVTHKGSNVIFNFSIGQKGDAPKLIEAASPSALIEYEFTDEDELD